MNKPDALPDAWARPSWKTSLTEALPYGVKVLMSAYRMARGVEFYVEVPDMPPTANHIYKKFYNPKLGRVMVANDKRVEGWRQQVEAACWRREFKPKGTVACIIAIESSAWVTKEYKIRPRDIDNPVKATLDALQQTLRFRDEIIWEVHSAKIFSRRDATHIWLFDLGDVVTAIGNQSLLTKGAP